MDDFVDGWSGDRVSSDKVTNASSILVEISNFSTLNGHESCSFVDGHRLFTGLSQTPLV